MGKQYRSEGVIDYHTHTIGITLFEQDPVDQKVIQHLRAKMPNPNLKKKTFTKTQIEHIVYNPELEYLYTGVQDRNKKISIMNFLKSLMMQYRGLKKIRVFFSNRDFTYKNFNCGPHGFYYAHEVLKLKIPLSKKFRQVASLGGVQDLFKTLDMGFYDTFMFEYIQDRSEYQDTAINMLYTLRDVKESDQSLFFDDMILFLEKIIKSYRVMSDNPIIRLV